MKNDVAIPEILKRLTPADAMHAIEMAGIETTTADRARILDEMHAVVRRNQQQYREEVAALRNGRAA